MFWVRERDWNWDGGDGGFKVVMYLISVPGCTSYANIAYFFIRKSSRESVRTWRLSERCFRSRNVFTVPEGNFVVIVEAG